MLNVLNNGGGSAASFVNNSSADVVVSISGNSTTNPVLSVTNNAYQPNNDAPAMDVQGVITLNNGRIYGNITTNAPTSNHIIDLTVNDASFTNYVISATAVNNGRAGAFYAENSYALVANNNSSSTPALYVMNDDYQLNNNPLAEAIRVEGMVNISSGRIYGDITGPLTPPYTPIIDVTVNDVNFDEYVISATATGAGKGGAFYAEDNYALVASNSSNDPSKATLLVQNTYSSDNNSANSEATAIEVAEGRVVLSYDDQNGNIPSGVNVDLSNYGYLSVIKLTQGPITSVTLPTNPKAGQILYIINATASAITIAGVNVPNGRMIMLVSDGINWYPQN
jgi:hypothetical protein